MQLSFKSTHPVQSEGCGASSMRGRLADLAEGEGGVLDSIDLPEDLATRLMELGFIPGADVVAARSAPGGDPRVFRVDGSEIALRHETAVQMFLKK